MREGTERFVVWVCERGREREKGWERRLDLVCKFVSGHAKTCSVGWLLGRANFQLNTGCCWSWWLPNHTSACKQITLLLLLLLLPLQPLPQRRKIKNNWTTKFANNFFASFLIILFTCCVLCEICWKIIFDGARLPKCWRAEICVSFMSVLLVYFETELLRQLEIVQHTISLKRFLAQ